VTGSLARGLARAGQATREVVPALGVLGRVLRAAVAPPAGEPAVGLLEAPPLVRDGAPTSVHVRIVNPSAAPREVDVVVEGSADDGRAFRAAWRVRLAPGTADERFVVTAWRGDVDVQTTDPGLPYAWETGAPCGTWHLVARAGASAPLAIAGAFVR
jgi:hypothetical protein